MSESGRGTAFSCRIEPEGIALVTFDRPETLNALAPDDLRALARQLEALAADEAIRGLVLTGAGRSFCSGADLSALMACVGAQGLAEPMIRALFDEAVNPVQRALAAMPKPIVCALNGLAAGGGVGLALAGDVVLAAPEAGFRLTFVPNLAIVPDLGSSWHLTRLAGRGRALSAMLTGEAIGAEEALGWGLVRRIVPQDELLERALETARHLARGPRALYPQVRALVEDAAQLPLSAQLDRERDLNIALCGSPDFVEGVRAFLEKRRPRF